MTLRKQHRKKYRYTANNLTLWTPPLLAIILISIYIAAPRLYRAERLAFFDIYNANQELKTRMKRAAASLPKQWTQSPFSDRTLQAV